MSQKLEWLFELGADFDPIKKATGALGKFDQAIGKATGKIGGKATPALGKLSTTFGKLGPGLKDAAIGIAKVGAAMAGAAIVGAAALGAVGAKYAIDAAVFKEQTLTAFKTFTGSTAAASDLYGKVLAASDKFAVAPRDAMDSVKSLLAAGFKMEQAMEIFAGATDLSKLTGGDTKALTVVLGQIKSKGKLQTEELLQLAESGGLGMDKVITEIGKLKGIDTSVPEGLAKVQKMLEGGKIDSQTGILAAMNAIKGMTGKDLGGFAEEAGKGVGGLLQRLKNMPQQWLLAFDASGAMGPLQKALGKLVELVGPESAFAKSVIATMGRLANLLGSVFDSASGGGGLESVINGLASAFDIVATALEYAWPYLKALGGGLFDGLSKTLGPLLAKLKGMGGTIDQETIQKWTQFGETVGKLIGGLVWLAGLLGGPVLDAFMSTISWLGTWWGILDALATAVLDFLQPLIDLGVEIWDIGASLVDGLWEGIKSGWAWLIQQFEGLVDMLPDAVKTALGIASPSKVMKQLGKFTMQGFEIGLSDEAANINGALSAAVAAPSPGQMAGGLASLGGGGGGGFSGDVIVQVNAPGATANDAKAIADAAAAAARDELERMFATG